MGSFPARVGPNNGPRQGLRRKRDRYRQLARPTERLYLCGCRRQEFPEKTLHVPIPLSRSPDASPAVELCGVLVANVYRDDAGAVP
jgi:hypothetical protein